VLHEVRKRSQTSSTPSLPHSAFERLRGVFVVCLVSFIYKMNTFVVGVFMGKPLFVVLDKIFKRDVFHAFSKSLHLGVTPVFLRPLFSSFFSSHIPTEVSFG
jgi:hypothetical protein